jgi:pilus assembly protein CpaE
MPESAKILIIDGDSEALERTKAILEAGGYQPLATVTGQAGVLMARLQRPSLILLEVDLPDIDGYQICRALRGTAGLVDVPILMYSARQDVSDKVAGFNAGANDYVIKPAAAAELIARIKAAMRSEDQPLACIVALWGSKGGVGTTTIATNLAIALQSVTAKRVTLFDASLLAGTLGVMLNMEPRHTLADLLTRVDDLDYELLSSVVAEHSSGVRVLLSPQWSTNGHGPQPEQLAQILAWLQQANDYVVVDTSPSLDQATSRVLQLSHQVLVVLTPQMSSLRNARLFLREVETWDQMSQKVMLLLNRYPVKGGLPLKSIQQALGKEFVAQVPDDERLVTYSINRGIPLMLSHPRSPVAKHVQRLAQHVIAGMEKRPRASVLSTILGGR